MVRFLKYDKAISSWVEKFTNFGKRVKEALQFHTTKAVDALGVKMDIMQAEVKTAMKDILKIVQGLAPGKEVKVRL
jgi:hypothetical protein